MLPLSNPLLTSHWGTRSGLRSLLSGRRLAGSAFVCRIQLANHPLELGWISAYAQALVRRHFAVHVQLVQSIVERLHAPLLSGLHRRIDLVDLVVTYQRADRGGNHENLRRHYTTLTLRLRQQRLSDDSLEHERQLSPHLGLL